MDLGTIEKLSAKLNLLPIGSTQPPRTSHRRKVRESKPLCFLSQYYELIRREKQHISSNRFAQELASHAVKRRFAPVSSSPPQSHRGASALDPSIATLKEHLRIITRGRSKRPAKTRRPPAKSETVSDYMLPLERMTTRTEDLWRSDLPELTATKYGEFRLTDTRSVLRVFNNQAIRKASQLRSQVATTSVSKSIDTQTPEPLSPEIFRETTPTPFYPMRPLPVHRLHFSSHLRALSAQDNYSDLEQKTC